MATFPQCNLPHFIDVNKKDRSFSVMTLNDETFPLYFCRRAAAALVYFLLVVVGRRCVCPAPFSDDHHCASRRHAGWPPTCQEHHVDYQCQENNELWRWEVWTEDEISFVHTSLCTVQGVTFIVLDPYCSFFWMLFTVFIFVSAQYLVDSLIVTTHWFHICHLRNWVQAMHRA